MLDVPSLAVWNLCNDLKRQTLKVQFAGDLKNSHFEISAFPPIRMELKGSLEY